MERIISIAGEPNIALTVGRLPGSFFH